ncbi:hypothetical protein BDC45DRAFT_540791 [Circinella umbellata]|nr:hypothetical protein BDC45DRAFT_540791 [Circinella umbellata]
MQNTLDELLKHRKLHDFDPIVQSDLFGLNCPLFRSPTSSCTEYYLQMMTQKQTLYTENGALFNLVSMIQNSVFKGNNLTLYIEDCPTGSVIYIKAIMKATLVTIKNDYEIVLPSIEGPDPSPLPPCMPSPKIGSKRKINQT